MEKTKLEILNEQHAISIRGMESINTKQFPVAYKEQALNAMTEYAKQEAIEFGHFLDYKDDRNISMNEWYNEFKSKSQNNAF